MPSDISHANSCEGVFVCIMCISLHWHKLLIEMLISCIFVNLNREKFVRSLSIIPENNRSKKKKKKNPSWILNVQSNASPLCVYIPRIRAGVY